MIATITFNPAIDTLYKLDTFNIGSVKRPDYVNKTPGGKGINVSKVLNTLGETPTCLGFLGGYNGLYIKEEIEKVGLKNEFIKINGETRICLNILDKNNVSTEILEKGPTVDNDNIKEFEHKLRNILKDTKVLVASGSLLQGLPNDYYKIVGDICKEEDVKFILDTSGKYLEGAFGTDIYLIKPNKDELEALTNIKIECIEDVINSAQILLDKGIENVCVSMGKEGMILLNKEHKYIVKIPTIDIKNAVGSGDASIAGFAFGILNNYSLEECLKLSNACGMSNALYLETGKIEVEDIKIFIKEIEVKKYELSYK